MKTASRRVVRHLDRQGRLRDELAAALWEQRRLRRVIEESADELAAWQWGGKPTLEPELERLRRALNEMTQKYEDLRRMHDSLALERLQELGEL